MATPQLGTREYTDYLKKQAQALGANQQGVFQPSPPKVSSVAKPGALEKLSNTPAFQLGPQKPGIVPQVYSSSLGGPTPPTSSGGQIDYTQPSSQYVSPIASGSGYAPAPNLPPPPPKPAQSTSGTPSLLSGALDALKRAGGAFVSVFKSGAKDLY